MYVRYALTTETGVRSVCALFSIWERKAKLRLVSAANLVKS
jgi:hypothetical protein